MRRALPLLALSSVLAASGCSSASSLFTKEAPKPCPQILALADAAKLTQYREGRGRDITDIEVEAEIAAFQGECKYTKTGVDVTMKVAIDAKRGPADTDRKANIAFFIAIPAFYPAASAKEVFPVALSFPDNTNMARYTEEEITLSIPLKSGELADKYEIYMGLQLDAEQLQRNRVNRR